MATDRPACAKLSAVAPAGRSVASYTTGWDMTPKTPREPALRGVALYAPPRPMATRRGRPIGTGCAPLPRCRWAPNPASFWSRISRSGSRPDVPHDGRRRTQRNPGHGSRRRTNGRWKMARPGDCRGLGDRGRPRGPGDGQLQRHLVGHRHSSVARTARRASRGGRRLAPQPRPGGPLQRRAAPGRRRPWRHAHRATAPPGLAQRRAG